MVVLQLKPTGGDFIDGLLGTSYFMQNALGINFIKQYIINYSSTDSINLSGFSCVNIQTIGHSPAINVAIKINDTLTISGNFIVDIGSPATTINSYAVAQYALDKNVTRKARYYTKYAGIGGDSAGYDFVSDSVSIAGFTFKKPTISYSIDTAGFFYDDGYLGILGSSLLSRFHLIFDFKNSKLYFKPNSSFNDPFIYDRMGFTFNDRSKTRGGWIVASLTEGSEAEKCGLRTDDIIKKVNGVAVESIPYLLQKSYFDNIDRVNLELQRDDSLFNVSFDLISLL